MMLTMYDYVFSQDDGLGWCDYNGGIQDRPMPSSKYIISMVNTKSQPYLGGDVDGAQYVSDIIDGEILTRSYHDTTEIKQFDSIQEAIDWIESNGVKFIGSGLQVFLD